VSTLPEVLQPVENYIDATYLVAFDGCHKIYMAFDAYEAKWFKDEYPHTVEGSSDEMLKALHKWWDASCGLKFVNGVVHDEVDPNRGFTTIVPQGAEQDFEECDDCGSVGDTGDFGLCSDCDEAWFRDEDEDEDEDDDEDES